MQLSTMIVKEGAFGWYISDGKSQYLRKDGTIRGSTREDNGEYAYWPTEQVAQDFLISQQGKPMDLKQLAIEHPYYCHTNNYTNNEAQQRFDTMSDFLEEFDEADVDMNLVFRWDVFEKRDEDDEGLGVYRAEVFIMQQRRGNFTPCIIKSITEEELEPFIKYLHKHFQRLQEMWEPLTTRPMEGLT